MVYGLGSPGISRLGIGLPSAGGSGCVAGGSGGCCVGRDGWEGWRDGRLLGSVGSSLGRSVSGELYRVDGDDLVGRSRDEVVSSAVRVSVTVSVGAEDSVSGAVVLVAGVVGSSLPPVRSLTVSYTHLTLPTNREV